MSLDMPTMRTRFRRPITAAIGAAAMLGAIATPAQAAGSFTSYLAKAGHDFDSRRWNEAASDVNTKIVFEGCFGRGSVNVSLAKDITAAPDPFYSMANFTNCFTGNTAQSTGTWGDHGGGNYYFVIDVGMVGGGVTNVNWLKVSW
ncbi:hypothetical protein [Streptomyces sp. NBC_01244]|uniref:hypothetical protein n=1 Tax=Streptomyces sp. NBC_01244 TaxID=2903797 RepID=UPI002E0D6336|nr:hypothetical protein OG247_18235 [Streptomyces sp. NBC_01244]